MSIQKKKDIRALFFYEGKLITWTKRSHGAGKLDGEIPEFIRKQMRLTRRQFQDLIGCPLGLPEYIQILRTQGLIQQATGGKPSPAGIPQKR